MSEQLAAGETILHNEMYYVPVGDQPWLAGNGSVGFWMAPFLWVLGWPSGVPIGFSLLWGVTCNCALCTVSGIRHSALGSTLSHHAHSLYAISWARAVGRSILSGGYSLAVLELGWRDAVAQKALVANVGADRRVCGHHRIDVLVLRMVFHHDCGSGALANRFDQAEMAHHTSDDCCTCFHPFHLTCCRAFL